MNDRPHFENAMVYSDPNKKLLKEWLWKTYKVTLNKDHRTLQTVTREWAGFVCKAGTFYYAVITKDRTGKAL